MSNTTPWVLDASVLINVLATGHARQFLGCLPFSCVVERHAFDEVLRDPSGKLVATPPLRDLTGPGYLHLVELTTPEEFDAFLDLTGASPPDDLGDGESGSIAVARCRALVVGTDDRKARRVAAKDSGVELGTSIDLFRTVQSSGQVEGPILASWLDGALRLGRMRVLERDVAWVRLILGDGSLDQFPSLRKSNWLRSDDLLRDQPTDRLSP